MKNIFQHPMSILSLCFAIVLPAGPARAQERPSSALEIILARAGGKVPRPFQAFLDAVDGDSKGMMLGSFGQRVLNPKTRAPAYHDADFKDPFVSFSKSTADGRVFIGYSAKLDQVQAISWNPYTKKNDYFVINDYSKKGKDGSGEPVLEAADKARCNSCHQHEGAVYPHAPWRESNSVFHLQSKGASLYSRIMAERGEREYAGVALEVSAEADRGAVNEGMDKDVRLSAMDLQLGEMCRFICPKSWQNAGLNCRKLMLTGALAEVLLGKNMDFRPSNRKDSKGTLAQAQLQYSYGDYLAHARTSEEGIDGPARKAPPKGFDLFENEIKKRWPEGGFAYPSSVLLDKDPLSRDPHHAGYVYVGKGVSKSREAILALNFDENWANESGIIDDHDSTYQETPLNLADREAGGDLAFFAALADPSHARPAYGKILAKDAAKYLYANASKCFWGSLNQAAQVSRALEGKVRSEEDVVKIVNSQIMAQVLKGNWPVDGQDLLRSLVAAAGADSGVGLACVKRQDGRTLPVSKEEKRSLSQLEGFLNSLLQTVDTGEDVDEARKERE